MGQAEQEQSAGDPAQAYESFFVPAMFAPLAALFLERTNPQMGERVLDVACGTGIVARRAAPFVGCSGRVVGLDPSPAMLLVARSVSDTEGVAGGPGGGTAVPRRWLRPGPVPNGPAILPGQAGDTRRDAPGAG